MIAPGIRPSPEVDEPTTAAIVAYVRRAGTPPAVPEPVREAAMVFSLHCARCHVIDGDGGTEGPDLSEAGRKHDLAWLRRWITRPEAMKDNAKMPAFGDKLSSHELETIAGYLASRGVLKR